MGRGIIVAKPFNPTQTLNAKDIDKGMTLNVPFNPPQMPIG